MVAGTPLNARFSSSPNAENMAHPDSTSAATAAPTVRANPFLFRTFLLLAIEGVTAQIRVVQADAL